MKKEVVIATAIAGLLSSLSAADVAPKVDMNKVTVDRTGKVMAPKNVQDKVRAKGIKGGADDKKWNGYCPTNNCKKPGMDVTQKTKPGM